jgi:trehalose-phosphatase
MTGGLRREMDRLLAAYCAGRALALLFDYDGTLVPIVAHPALATLPAESRALLEELSQQPQLTVGVVSGRRLEELKQMVGLPELCYSGVSGMELELNGLRIVHPQATTGHALIARLAAPLGDLAAAYPGAWVEDKDVGLTLHYRAVSPHRLEELRGDVRQVLRSFMGELRILDVAMAVEITPAFGWTKRSAVQRMVDYAGRDAFPLYAGDEANDRDALEIVRDLGGIAIGIGPRAPSSAEYLLPDPAALLSWLRSFLAALGVAGSRRILPNRVDRSPPDIHRAAS